MGHGSGEGLKVWGPVYPPSLILPLPANFSSCFYLFSVFPCRESCWRTLLMSVEPLGIFEGTFYRTGAGTRLSLSMQRQMPILIALMGSGRGNTLTVNCLLRALEQAQALARPGTPSSTYLPPLTVCCGSCWDKPQSTLRFVCFSCKHLDEGCLRALCTGNGDGSQTLCPQTCLGRFATR